MPVAAAFGAIAAGTMGNLVLHAGASLLGFKYAVLGTLVAILIVFCAPLLAFSLRLSRVWRRGVYDYSTDPAVENSELWPAESGLGA